MLTWCFMKAYKKPPGIAVPRGFLLLGLMLTVHKELFVKPFADIVRNDTCCDGQRERWNRRQSASPPSQWRGGGDGNYRIT